jgi:hypothetical protein
MAEACLSLHAENKLGMHRLGIAGIKTLVCVFFLKAEAYCRREY